MLTRLYLWTILCGIYDKASKNIKKTEINDAKMKLNALTRFAIKT